jgi:hypothetical protein
MIDLLTRKPLSPQSVQKRLETRRVFERYCAAQSLVAVPASAETVIGYLERRVCSTGAEGILCIFRAILEMQVENGFRHLDNLRPFIEPILRKSRTGIMFRPLLSKEDLLKTVRSIGMKALIDCRDQAILLASAGGWLLRRELPVLHTDFLVSLPTKGMQLFVPGSRAREIVLPRIDHTPELCPVRAIRRFLARVEEVLGKPYRGPLFPKVGAGKSFGKQLGLAQFKQIAFKRFTTAGVWVPNLGIGSLRTSAMVSAVSAGIPNHEIERRGGFRSEQGFQRFRSRARRLYIPLDYTDL